MKHALSTTMVGSILAIVSLSGCGERATEPDGAPTPDATPVAEQTEEAAVSILRPEVEQPSQEAEVLGALTQTIGFPDGGSELDAEAIQALETVLQSEQLALGGPIVLGGHSDSAGGDRVNMDAAQERALAVAVWLIEHGVESSRIDVIVFGEQNPIAPNALPNGEPDEQGRAANRRVEIEVPTIEISSAADNVTGEDDPEGSTEFSD